MTRDLGGIVCVNIVLMTATWAYMGDDAHKITQVLATRHVLCRWEPDLIVDERCSPPVP